MGRERHLRRAVLALVVALAILAVCAPIGAWGLQADGKDGGGLEDLIGGALVGSIPALFPAALAGLFAVLHIIERARSRLSPSCTRRPLRTGR